MENISNKETDIQSAANETSDVKNTVTNAKPEKAPSKNNDKSKKKKKKLNWKICLVAVIAGLLVWYITLNEGFKIKEDDNGKAVIWFKGIRDIDFWVTDKMFQRGGMVELPITIIGIDEYSMDLNGMGLPSTWERDVYTRLIERLCEDFVDKKTGEIVKCEPAVIAFDILMTANKDPEKDQAFADVCEKYGSVVTGMYLNYGPEFVNHKFTDVVQFISYPYQELKDVVRCGFTNNDVNQDNAFRFLTTQDSFNGEKLLPLSLATYKVYAEKNNIEAKEFSEDEKSFMFTYTSGKDNGNGKSDKGGMQYFSIWDVLYNTSETYSDKTQDNIVLVGAYASGLSDDFFTPVDRKNKMNGVEVHANEIEAFYKNKLQTLANKWVVSIIYGLLTACLIIIVYLVSLPIAGAITAGSIIIDFITCIILFKANIYLSIVYYIIPAVITLVTAIVMHYLSARAEKAKINNAFKMYVAPEIVDEMATDGKFELKLGGQTKDIAVLFIDIRGFTTMSEKLSPEEVVSILNEYFDLVTDAIFKNKGTIDKFVGDAAMAVFNSPNDLDDYVYRAVHTGWDILLGTQDLMVKLEEKHHRTIGFGIGVNCGPATVGNIGSEFRMDYTAIGDTVNTSARLEANAAAGQILISQDVLDRVSEWVEVEKVEGIKLKGKSNEFNIYNVTKVIDKPGYLESGISIRKKK